MIKGIYKDKRAKNESDTVFIQSVSDFISHSTNMSLYWVCRVKNIFAKEQVGRILSLRPKHISQRPRSKPELFPAPPTVGELLYEGYPKLRSFHHIANRRFVPIQILRNGLLLVMYNCMFHSILILMYDYY